MPAGASRSIAPAGSTARERGTDDLLQAGGIGLLNAVERYDAYKERHLQLTQCSVSVALCW